MRGKQSGEAGSGRQELCHEHGDGSSLKQLFSCMLAHGRAPAVIALSERERAAGTSAFRRVIHRLPSQGLGGTICLSEGVFCRHTDRPRVTQEAVAIFENLYRWAAGRGPASSNVCGGHVRLRSASARGRNVVGESKRMIGSWSCETESLFRVGEEFPRVNPRGEVNGGRHTFGGFCEKQ